MAASSPAVSVLFVCLGNHCRSPAAHAVALALSPDPTVARFDSAGTSSAHVGDTPNPMSVAEGAHRGYRVDHRSRQVHPDDREELHQRAGRAQREGERPAAHPDVHRAEHKVRCHGIGTETHRHNRPAHALCDRWLVC